MRRRLKPHRTETEALPRFFDLRRHWRSWFRLIGGVERVSWETQESHGERFLPTRCWHLSAN